MEDPPINALKSIYEIPAYYLDIFDIYPQKSQRTFFSQVFQFSQKLYATFAGKL